MTKLGIVYVGRVEFLRPYAKGLYVRTDEGERLVLHLPHGDEQRVTSTGKRIVVTVEVQDDEGGEP